jgi:DNA-binding CsgD family transcriptional regulator
MQIDRSQATLSLPVGLTSREKDVLGLLLRRLSNKEIASILGITDRTVKFHVGNLLNKLQVRSRHELALTWMAAVRTA